MADADFPAIGFDPAPGDTSALTDVGSSWSRLGDDLAAQAAGVDALHDGVMWRGRAGQACVERLRVVPADLHQAADAYRLAGRVVSGYADQLRRLQSIAAGIEAEAQRATAAIKAAADDKAHAAAQQRLADILDRALQVRDDAGHHADDVHRLLSGACAHAPHQPGWFHRMLHGLGDALHQVATGLHDLVVRLAPQIEAVADWCSKAASVLAEVGFVASLVPGVGDAVGGVAVALSLGLTATALAGHAALAAVGKQSWKSVAFDAATLTVAVVSHGLDEPIAAQDDLALEEAATQPAPWRDMPSMTTRGFALRAVKLHVDGAGATLGAVDLAKIPSEWPAMLGRERPRVRPAMAPG